MALESTVIVDKLKEEGINESLAVGLSFETEENLTSWVNTFKTAIPQTKDIKDYTKDELEELAKDPQFKGAKGLQGFIDSIRSKSKPSNPTTITQTSDEPSAWAKVISEKLEKLETQMQIESFESIVSKLGKEEGLSDVHIARVKKSLGKDATEAQIKAEVKAYKAELTEAGITSFGTPGGGSGKNSGNVDLEKATKAWAEQQKKNLKR